MPFAFGLMILSTILTIITFHWLISDINRTKQVPRIVHKARFDSGDISEIKQLHRELLPNSGRYTFFKVLEVMQWTFAGMMAVFLIYSFTDSVLNNAR